MQLSTRFTRRFGLKTPIALAPMAGAAGGALAAAVSQAGGLGLIGGGYGQADWLEAQWPLAEGAEVGVGFITWAVTPQVIAAALERRPRAMMLSFGDQALYAAQIRAAGVPLISQVQSLEMARQAVDAGAEVIVAQGSEAGGHGASRGTFTLVPELADYLAAHAPEVLLLAAGGIADGRGLAAALTLGADGVLIGSRFWAAQEALVPAGFQAAALAATGDQTLRSSVPDAARLLNWPSPFTIRTLESQFTARWQHNTESLRSAEGALARKAWQLAQSQGDAERGTAIVGEAVGLLHDLAPAADLLSRITGQASEILHSRAGSRQVERN